MIRTFFIVLSLFFMTGVTSCSEEKLPSDLPSDDGPISLTGGAV